MGLHRKSQFEQLCSTAVEVSASFGEPALLNCWYSEVNLEISWFKTCCCLRKVFIICTSSSSAAISFCADGHVNCNCFGSFHCERSREHKALHCEESESFRRSGEHKTIHCSVSRFNTLLSTFQSVTSFPTRVFGQSLEELPWNRRTSTPHRSETNWIAARAVRRINKERLLYCCNQAWMKNGGLFLWNAIAVCDMFKIFWKTGKLFTKGDSVNH